MIPKQCRWRNIAIRGRLWPLIPIALCYLPCIVVGAVLIELIRPGGQPLSDPSSALALVLLASIMLAAPLSMTGLLWRTTRHHDADHDT
jgi:hypothetical protein